MTEGNAPSVHTAAALFQELCYTNKDALSAGIIIGGWDKFNGPSVWSIPLGGSLHRQPFAIGGSGSTYIYGYCDAAYKEGMSKEEAIQFTKNGKRRSSCSFLKRLILFYYVCHCAYYAVICFMFKLEMEIAIALAMSRDGSSGGVIRLAVITESGVERIFTPGDKLPKFWEG
jgi:20S proteasome subunit beta 1